VIRALLLAACVLLGAPAAGGVRLVDDAGRSVELSAPPQRIVALAPHLTELLYAVGAGAQVVGVDSASDYPAAARALPRVGDATRIRFERVLALQPDLVVVWMGGNRAVDVHGLERLGVPVLRTQARRLDDVARLLRLLGRASGHADAGEAAARAVAARLDALHRHHARAQPLPVFYQVWERPLITVGGGHWISEALAVCGARNVFADVDAMAPVVSREAVLRRAPHVILGGSDAPGLRRAWRRFASVPAVSADAFVLVDADRLHRPTPRLVDGVAALCAALQPYGR
jgi:iron complex transport system substrate-binding protein